MYTLIRMRRLVGLGLAAIAVALWLMVGSAAADPMTKVAQGVDPALLPGAKVFW